MAGHQTPAGIVFPKIVTPPSSTAFTVGAGLRLSVNVTATTPTYQWFKNGSIPPTLTGATSTTIDLANLSATDAGLYDIIASNNLASVTSPAAIVGPTTSAKVTGSGTVVGSDIRHPNGNIFDQVLLTGLSASVTADPGKITRTSFVDGATTLSVRTSTVNATIGMMTTVTCDVVFHGSHLNLMKISQTKPA